MNPVTKHAVCKRKSDRTHQNLEMNGVIPVNYDSEIPTVSGRGLHEALHIETRYNDWFPRMCACGFIEGKDFYSILSNSTGGLR
jgi:anti-repressor protein